LNPERTSPDPTSEELLRNFRAALSGGPVEQTLPPSDVLEWLALVPVWPQGVVASGFPLRSGFVRGPDAVKLLEELADDGWVEAGEAMPPWSGRIYSMSRAQRRRAIRAAQNQAHQSSGSLWDQAARAWEVLSDAQREFGVYPPSLQRWFELLRRESPRVPPDLSAVADRLISAVNSSLKEAESLGLEGSPETAVILDAAEPLASALGGPIRVAVSRCQRELELHHRRTRDKKLLENYEDRKELVSAFETLLASSDDGAWALHYIGEGGVGKTMFLRYLQAELSEIRDLATARVDFDHLNPDYPLRSPGLLLLSFAEELKFHAPAHATDLFRKLEHEVTNVHIQLEAAQRDGRDVPLGFDAAGFELCQTLFVEALGGIRRAGLRPVLILDTCEELARLRFDGKLPRTVVETFRIIEDLHARAPYIRVVFSGRRPLAREGAGWTWATEELPKRDYLSLCPLLGFDRREALQVLEKYRRKDRSGREIPVGAKFHEGILRVSQWELGQEFTDLSPAPPGLASGVERYNPYNLFLYAGWVTADDTIAPEKLRGHHYIRERIVNRLREDLKACLPYLTVLGRFDQELIRELQGGDEDVSGLWDEIRQQEWTDIERSSGGNSDQLAITFWHLDHHLLERFQSFYEEEMPGPWFAARRRVAEVLERLTIDRDWVLLTPSYFDVAATLLRDEPIRAAAWWRKVENKILETGAWEWADRITAAMLDIEGSLGPTLQDSAHPLDAPVRALRANVQMRSSHTEILDSLWSDVGKAAAAYPEKQGQQLLRFRAAAGLIAYLRYRSETLNQADAGEFQTLLNRVPGLHETLDIVDVSAPAQDRRQILQTEMALLDNSVEVLEEVHWGGKPPAQLVESILDRASEFAQVLSAQSWLDPYIQRVRLLAGDVNREWSWEKSWQAPMPDLPAPGFDWIPPRRPDARLLLECGRILETGRIKRPISRYCDEARGRVQRPYDPDEDRLLSQAYRLQRWRLVEPFIEDALMDISVALAVHREECQAHKKVPPLFVTLIQQMAGEGRIDKSLSVLQRIRSTQPAENIVRWLDRIANDLNNRFLLAETRGGAQLPALPFEEDNPSDVTRFCNETTANLRQLTEHNTLPPDSVERQTRSAQAVSSVQGFKLPLKTLDLTEVSPGWRPWFARYLVVRIMAQSPIDEVERRAIEDYLRALYETELPSDVAFVAEGTARTKTDLAETSPASAPKPSSNFWPLVVGLAIFALFITFGVWVADFGIDRIFDRDVAWWGDLLVFMVGMTSLGGLAKLAPPLFRLYVRAASTLVECDSQIVFDNNNRQSIDWSVRMAWPMHRFMRRAGLWTVESIDPTASYLELSRSFSDPENPKPPRESRGLGRILRETRIRNLIVVSGGVAQGSICWEAVLGTQRGRLEQFSRCMFLFRRVGDRSWRVERPFPLVMSIVSISSIRDLGAWKERLRDRENMSAKVLTTMPTSSDPNVGVLMLQAEVSIGGQGMRLATQSGSRVAFGAEDLARLFPNLRVLVLIGLDRSEAAPRTPTDRIIAGQARMAAHELFQVAAPAVIYIPGLPASTALIDETLGRVVDVIRRQPGNVVPRLQWAVRTIQDSIFENSGLEAADATELAYDVCYYAADTVDMRIQPAPINSQKPSRGTRA
jgi:hypothetical protein